MTTKEERDKDYINSEIGNTFNTYKIIGAKLLEDGLITADEFHQKVKEYGTFVGAINPEDPDIPDKIDDTPGLRMAAEIGGAVVGAVKYGGSIANPFGFVGYVASQSIASGAGAAAGNAIYNYAKKMFSPEAVTDAQLKDSLELGQDVAGFNAAFMAGVPVAGKAAKIAYTATKGGVVTTLKTAGAAGEAIGLSKPVQSMREFANKYASTQNDLANEVLKEAQKHGVVLNRAMVLSPTFRSIAEAFSRTPFIGTPLRESYDKALSSTAKKLVDDIESGYTIEQAASRFSDRFKLNPSTGKYEVFRKEGYNPDNINIQAYASLLRKSDSFDTQWNKTVDNLFIKTDKAGREIKVGSGLFATNATLRQNFNPTNLLRWWGQTKNIGSDIRFPAEFKKLMDNLEGQLEDGVQIGARQMKDIYKQLNNVERDLLNKVDGAYADDLYQGFATARASFEKDILNAAAKSSPKTLEQVQAGIASIKSTKEKQLEFIEKADNAGLLSAVNRVFRDPDSEFTKKLNTELRGDYVGKLKAGDYFVLPGSTVAAVKRAMGKDTASYEEVVRNLFIKGGEQQHRNLMEIIGQKQYAKLAQNELDDILDGTVMDFLNTGAGNGRQEFLKKIGALGTFDEKKANKARTELLLKNINMLRKDQKMITYVNGKKVQHPLAPITYDSLKGYGELLSFLPERPALNQFIQRSLALKLAGNISVASLTGFVGIGGSMAAGGPLAGLVAAGGFRLLASVLSKPYKYDGFTEALQQAGANPEARKKAFDALEQEASHYGKIISGAYEKNLRERNGNLLAALRTMTATTAAQNVPLTDLVNNQQ